MILINKGVAPESLVAYQRYENAYFEGCNKDDIRESLLKEQGYLCAYCMRRIGKDTMKIEHWYPRSRMTDKECLDYSNMLGCCLGHNTGDNGKNDTCDTRKGDLIIAINPLNPLHIDRIKYKSDGTIYSDEEEIIVTFESHGGLRYEDKSSLQHDINVTLNLNEEKHYLKQNRKAVLDGVKNYISRKSRTGKWTAQEVKKMIHLYEQVDECGYRKEYAGIVLWYLKRKLK